MDYELNKYVYDCAECGFCKGERKMTNAEKYREEIENFKGDFCENFVQPTILKRDTCEGMGCVQCRMTQMMWLMDEYKEPETDWSKVAVDTPILVRNFENRKWLKRYFAKFESGIVYAWDDGRTSWNSNGDIVEWNFAKLAEDKMDNLSKAKDDIPILMTAWGYEKLAGEGDE